jgi:hypothetical protein
MEYSKEAFIKAYPNFKIRELENKFLLIENISQKQGAELCKLWKASGYRAGKNYEHFAIGNFGLYR